MPLSPSWQAVIQQRLSRCEAPHQEVRCWPVGGGSINETYLVRISNRDFFCKVNSATKFPQLFLKERQGLALLGTHGIIKVPSCIDCFEYDSHQVLVLEWIAEGEKTDTFWKKFGEKLARLHLISHEQFGLSEDNYMGSVPQLNRQHGGWPAFFLEERLQPMIKRCVEKKLLTAKHVRAFNQLNKHLSTIFKEEPPALLHGDLWNGNFLCNQHNEPVLIDPAVYYGHRSVDLAMTTLFGGFRQPFYDAYHYHFPLPANYKEQWEVCNLYPLLIHLYLFGSSYLTRVENTLSRYQ
jgi:fructosamine-3-kinase